MALTLHLGPQLEKRLSEAAEREGISVDEYTLRLLDKHLPAEDPRAKLVGLLQSWIDEGNSEEQRETGEYLVQVLDEDRLSDRKLFPPEQKGVSW